MQTNHLLELFFHRSRWDTVRRLLPWFLWRSGKAPFSQGVAWLLSPLRGPDLLHEFRAIGHSVEWNRDRQRTGPAADVGQSVPHVVSVIQ